MGAKGQFLDFPLNIWNRLTNKFVFKNKFEASGCKLVCFLSASLSLSRKAV